MRSVYVSLYMAYPPVSGAASVTWHNAKQTPGATTLIQLGDREREGRVDGVRIITLAGSGRGLGKLLAMHRLVRRIVKLCREIRPDVIVLEGASWAVYHWMLARALRRDGSAAKLWYHSHNVERTLRRQRNGRFIASVTGWAEGRLLREADRAFAVSEVDRQQFRTLYGVETELWPNGVDVERFASVTEEQRRSARLKYGIPELSLLFMGLYAYPPNRRAVDFLDREVMPRLLAKLPAARLVVIGGIVPFMREWLVNPGVIPFEELPAVVSACRVGVAPVFEGSGTRLKILECLAAGLPVVTTTKGAEGLEIAEGNWLWRRDDAAGFAEAVFECLQRDDNARQATCDPVQAYGYAAIAGRVWSSSPAVARRQINHPAASILD